MDRRKFLKVSGVVPAALGLSSAALAQATPWVEGTRWRAFEVTTRIDIFLPEGQSRVWVPVPLAEDTGYFKALGNAWNGNASAMRLERQPADGTTMFYAEWHKADGNPFIEFSSTIATRDRAVDLANPNKFEPADRGTLAENLKPTALIPTDGIVRATARKVTQKARTDMDKARAIYEWIVDNTYRDAKVRGCGWGDIKTMLETGNLGGKCGDLNALFVGLARASGIPARDLYGVRVAPSQWGYRSMSASDAITRAQHCRAEFYLPTHGWIPVDPADVRKVILEEPPGNLAITDDKVKLARQKLFGAWEMNWCAFNYAHDVRLPGSKGAALPYLMYPNAETGGERKDSLDPDNFSYSIKVRELTI